MKTLFAVLVVCVALVAAMLFQKCAEGAGSALAEPKRRTLRDTPDPTAGLHDVILYAAAREAGAGTAMVRASRSSRGSRPPGAAAPAQPDGVLACINRAEGSPAYDQRDGDPYSGRYQFDQRTWSGAVTRAGHPEWAGQRPYEAPPEVQDAAARQLVSERGLQPWPPAGKCA